MLSQRIDALERLLSQRIQSGWNEIQARFDADEKALKLQGVEYERRLEVLNNDRQEAREKEATFLPRDLWDEYVKSSGLWRDNFTEQINTLRTAKVAEHATFATHAELKGTVDSLAARIDQSVTSLSARMDQIERAAANLQGRLWMLSATLTGLVIVINWFMRYLGK